MSVLELTNKMYLEFYHLSKMDNKDTFAKDCALIAINYALKLQPNPQKMPLPYDEITQEFIDEINNAKNIIENAFTDYTTITLK